MRFRTIAAAAALLLLAIVPMTAGDVAEEGIRAAALDYIEGWYEGDSARMARALHPKLAKRAYLENPKTGEFVLQELDAPTLVGYVEKGGAKGVEPKDREIRVQIFDVYGNIATAKVTSRHFVDYMHLVRVGDEWKIINVLWDFSPSYMEELKKKRESTEEKPAS